MASLNSIGYSTNNTIQTNNKSTPLAIKAGIVGAGIGAVSGMIKKVPITNDKGEVRDDFVKKVYNRLVKKTTDEELKRFEQQRLNVMENINSITKNEELKNLINNNEELVDTAFASSNKKTKFLAKSRFVPIGIRKRNLLKSIDNAYKLKLDNLSSSITRCQNGTNKTLKKADCVSDELYKAIRNTKWSMKAKQVVKRTCIVGSIGGIATFLVTKFMDIRKNKIKTDETKDL